MRGAGRRVVVSAAMVLSPVLGKLVSKRVVLASASPRRQEILTNVVSAAEPLSFPPFGAGGGPARMSVARGGRRPALLRLLYCLLSLGRALWAAACLCVRSREVRCGCVGLLGVLLLSELSARYTCVRELT